MEYADCEFRSREYIYELVMRLLPNLSKFSNSRRKATVDSFHEVIHEPNTLLEREDTEPNFVYILLQGEVAFYKRAESRFTDTGRRIDSKDIPHMTNPKDSGDQSIGLKVSLVAKQVLLCEDAVIFKQKLCYSIKTNTRIVALRCYALAASTWSDEIQSKLKMNTLDKQMTFFSIVDKIEDKLGDSDN